MLKILKYLPQIALLLEMQELTFVPIFLDLWGADAITFVGDGSLLSTADMNRSSINKLGPFLNILP